MSLVLVIGNKRYSSWSLRPWLLMRHLGIGLCAVALPVAAIAGLGALAVAPTLWVIWAVMVAERAVAFGLANPAARPFVFSGSEEDLARAVDCLAAAELYEAGDDAVGDGLEIHLEGAVVDRLAESLDLVGVDAAVRSEGARLCRHRRRHAAGAARGFGPARVRCFLRARGFRALDRAAALRAHVASYLAAAPITTNRVREAFALALSSTSFQWY